MKQLFIFVLSLSLLGACGAKTNTESNPTEQSLPEDQTSDLKAGGLYAMKGKDGSYSISKILVLDDFAVHVRMYSNTFKEKPLDISSDSLEFIIGHAPMDKQGFLLDKPELIKVEEVKDAELEGYKLYLEAMSK